MQESIREDLSIGASISIFWSLVHFLALALGVVGRGESWENVVRGGEVGRGGRDDRAGNWSFLGSAILSEEEGMGGEIDF